MNKYSTMHLLSAHKLVCDVISASNRKSWKFTLWNTEFSE